MKGEKSPKYSSNNTFGTGRLRINIYQSYLSINGFFPAQYHENISIHRMSRTVNNRVSTFIIGMFQDTGE